MKKETKKVLRRGKRKRGNNTSRGEGGEGDGQREDQNKKVNKKIETSFQPQQLDVCQRKV